MRTLKPALRPANKRKQFAELNSTKPRNFMKMLRPGTIPSEIAIPISDMTAAIDPVLPAARFGYPLWWVICWRPAWVRATSRRSRYTAHLLIPTVFIRRQMAGSGPSRQPAVPSSQSLKLNGQRHGLEPSHAAGLAPGLQAGEAPEAEFQDLQGSP